MAPLYGAIVFHSNLVLPAITAIINPSTAINPSDTRKLVACATNPINGGPIKNPRYPIVDTAANATPGDNTFDRPAALYTNGTTDDTPAPTNRKPASAGSSHGKAIASNNPNAVIPPLTCSIRRIPQRVASVSPTNLPPAIVKEKAVNPRPINAGGGITTRCQYTLLQSNIDPSQIMEQNAMTPKLTSDRSGRAKIG